MGRPKGSKSNYTVYTVEQKLYYIKSIIEEYKLVIATTGFAVFSIIIVFGMTMSFKKKD